MSPGDVIAICSAIVAAGGTIARALRWCVKAYIAEKVEQRVFQMSLVEQTRRRERKESTQPPLRRRTAPMGLPVAAAVPRDEFAASETTDINHIMDETRAALTRRGERKPRAGTHHDEGP